MINDYMTFTPPHQKIFNKISIFCDFSKSEGGALVNRCEFVNFSFFRNLLKLHPVNVEENSFLRVFKCI